MKWLFLLIFSFSNCSTPPENEQDLLDGVIAYPFASRDQPLGKNGAPQKIVIKSTVGQTEYQIEVPGVGDDYDIEVPLADLGGEKKDDLDQYKPQQTDQELKKAMPKIESPDDRSLVEGAYGLGEAGGPKQGPSYVMGLAKINRHYLKRQFEFALIEINNLLGYYPTSVKLYKMKGTVLRKMRQYTLAKEAWQHGLDLEPGNKQIQMALSRLNMITSKDSNQ